MSIRMREATADELVDWDERAVRSSQGSVHQSRAWAAYRQWFGWQPVFLAGDDGSRILALGRRWPLVGGVGYYLARGPVPADDPADDPALTAARLATAVEWLAAHGATTIASDTEMPAATGYPDLLAAAGFRPIEELQPSRHRLALDLAAERDPEAILRGFHATTRNLIRSAERSDLDVRVRAGGVGIVGGGGSGDPWTDDLGAELAHLHGLMALTAQRRGFGLLSVDRFLDWSRRAYEAGLLVAIAARDPAGELVAGATFYRHGRRLTYSHAADDPRFRERYPGVVRQVLWRAIQQALLEGRTEMDLGGVDVPGARRRPVQGEAAYGMLTFKESFGARWVELSGAHEKVVRPGRNTLGRAAAKIVWRFSGG
jgi:lipid II:glycine glycyltransferase (peptidoglycan interpeptide bridge formation enzyme)